MTRGLIKSDLLYPGLWRGCVGAWCPSVDRSRGTSLTDWSPNRNHGTLTGMDPATDWVPSGGKVALDFDGVNDSVNIPIASPAINAMTISLWANVRTTGASVFPRFISNNISLGYGVGWDNANSQIFFSFNNVTQNSSTVSLIGVGWVHISVVYQSATAKIIYLNNEVIGSTIQTATLSASTTPIIIANVTTPNRVLDGQIDDVLLYYRALSPSEIALLARRRGIAYETMPTRYHMRGPTGGGGPTYTLTCDAGSFALTGIDAGLLAGRLLTADAGSFALTGIDAGLLASRLITADVGAFVLTGIDADLTYSGAVGPTYTLTCDAGSFALAGVNVGLLAGRLLTADAGAFTLTGIDTNVLANRLIAADAGSFVLTGIDAAFRVNRLLTADAGTFVLTGINANLSYSGATSPTASMYYYLLMGS